MDYFDANDLRAKRFGSQTKAFWHLRCAATGSTTQILKFTGCAEITSESILVYAYILI